MHGLRSTVKDQEADSGLTPHGGRMAHVRFSIAVRHIYSRRPRGLRPRGKEWLDFRNATTEGALKTFSEPSGTVWQCAKKREEVFSFCQFVMVFFIHMYFRR